MAKSFERIHSGNLVNFGILPLLFTNSEDYDRIRQGDPFKITGLHGSVRNGDNLKVEIGSSVYELKILATERQRKILLAGGLLNYTRENMIK